MLHKKETRTIGRGHLKLTSVLQREGDSMYGIFFHMCHTLRACLFMEALIHGKQKKSQQAFITSTSPS